MDKNAIELIQQQLWLDEELLELKQPFQKEEQDLQVMTAEGGQSQTVQLCLPGFEPE